MSAKILFSEMLENFKPKSKIEQVMVITKFSCGCVSTVTFGGFPTNFYGENTVSIGKEIWCSCEECSQGHKISFEELNDIPLSSLKFLATEIYAYNSIQSYLLSRKKND